ncbi:hypothetical protein ZOSMA_122G00060 [Zostera marina]|uniref:Ubiquitin-like protease family profile domain-containing protein n=1 Tax=Zostera marina TaxID=29655 RepID=A0A0K9Q0Q8_ZOSMR|nr:hypothetical protein ZOSMA_122G00060 [Zostera marina]
MEGRNYDLELDLSTNVDLSTPSPTSSFDFNSENPMNDLFRCIEMRETLASKENLSVNLQEPTNCSPVIVQGSESSEYMLVEDEIPMPDSITGNPPPEKMVDSSNILISSSIVDHEEVANKAISNGVTSTHSKIINDQAVFLNGAVNQTVCPPSFDLLHKLGIDVAEEKQCSGYPNSPVHLVRESVEKLSTPYAYSKSNLILVVEEGRSMYNQLVHDSRYRKVSLQKQNGTTFTQLHLNMDDLSPERFTEPNYGMSTPLMNDGNPLVKAVVLSSPEFWASAAASADELENSLRSHNSLITADVSDVVANIRKKEREVHDHVTIDGRRIPKLNELTKRLVMKPESRSLSFFFITNDSVSCLGQHLNDILQHKTYDVMLVKVFFGVLCAELTEKCVHRSKFQFVNPELFDDEDSNRTTRELPVLVKYRDLELHNRMVTASMNGDYKSHARFFIIAMRTMNHWHFLVWSRAGNKYTHYDSNREIRGAVNDGAAKRTAMWMTNWFQEFLFTDRDSEPEFINSLPYPQEINPKLDGGLYMLHRISCLIDYLHIEDGVFNNISLEDHMQWWKSDVPKIRNCLFRRLSERMEYGDWNEKMENSNAGRKRFKRR